MTAEQERIAKRLVENAHISHSENRPMADGSLEVWLYDHDDRLHCIATVFRDGSYGTRSPYAR